MQVGWKIENGGVFYAGDQVRGYARLKVHKSRKMEEVAVALIPSMGMEKAAWVETEQYIDFKGRIRWRVNRYSSKNTILRGRKVVVRRGEVLQPGVYKFPFSFKLRRTLPPTYSAGPGTISYALSMSARTSSLFSANGYGQKEITVKEAVPLLELSKLTLLTGPVSVRDSKAFLLAQGGVICEVHAPRQLVAAGETIEVRVLVKNQSGKNVNGIDIALVNRTTWTASRHTKVHEKTVQGVGVTMPGTCIVEAHPYSAFWTAKVDYDEYYHPGGGSGNDRWADHQAEPLRMHHHAYRFPVRGSVSLPVPQLQTRLRFSFAFDKFVELALIVMSARSIQRECSLKHRARTSNAPLLPDDVRLTAATDGVSKLETSVGCIPLPVADVLPPQENELVIDEPLVSESDTDVTECELSGADNASSSAPVPQASPVHVAEYDSSFALGDETWLDEAGLGEAGSASETSSAHVEGSGPYAPVDVLEHQPRSVSAVQVQPARALPHPPLYERTYCASPLPACTMGKVQGREFIIDHARRKTYWVADRIANQLAVKKNGAPPPYPAVQSIGALPDGWEWSVDDCGRPFAADHFNRICYWCGPGRLTLQVLAVAHMEQLAHYDGVEAPAVQTAKPKSRWRRKEAETQQHAPPSRGLQIHVAIGDAEVLRAPVTFPVESFAAVETTVGLSGLGAPVRLHLRHGGRVLGSGEFPLCDVVDGKQLWVPLAILEHKNVSLAGAGVVSGEFAPAAASAATDEWVDIQAESGGTVLVRVNYEFDDDLV